jgi:hypothetical protein
MSITDPIGYESNGSRRQEGYNHMMRIHSDLLKLPTFVGYSPANRTSFRKALVTVIKNSRAQFLMRNVQRQLEDDTVSHPPARPSAGEMLFTPAPQRRFQQIPRASPVQRQAEGKYEREHAHTRNRVPPAVPARVDSTQPRFKHVASPVMPTVFASVRPVPATNTHMGYSSAYGQGQMFTSASRSGRQASQTPIQSSLAMMSPLSSTRFQPEPSPLWPTPLPRGDAARYKITEIDEEEDEEGEWPVYEEEASSHHSDTLAGAQQTAALVSQSINQANAPAHTSPAEPTASSDAGSDVDAAAHNRAQASETGINLEQILNTLTELRQDHAIMIDRLRDEHERSMHDVEYKQAQMKQEMMEDKARWASLHGSTEGSDATEEWIALAQLEDDMRETHIWWDIEQHRPENEYQAQLRSRIYAELIRKLPAELYDQLPDGDVRAVYLNIISFGTQGASLQIGTLEQAILDLVKTGRPMAAFLTELYEYLRQLGILGQPRQTTQVRNTLVKALRPDPRYKSVMRDLIRRTDWTVPQMRHALENEALVIEDLLPKTVPVKLKANTLKGQRQSSDSESEDEPRGSTRGSRRKALLGKNLAHPPNDKAPKPKAEGPVLTQTEIEHHAQQTCCKFSLGTCNKGDSCGRNHTLLTEAQLSQVYKQIDVERKLRNKSNDDTGMCFAFQAKGSCQFGEDCRFSHAAPPKANVGKTALPPRMAQPNDQVLITDLCPYPNLCGRTGQAYRANPNNPARMLVQIDAPHTMCTGMRQWVQMANLEGLLISDYIVCSRSRSKGLSATARPAVNTGPYALNAIFDSGCNVFITSTKALFDPGTLHTLSTPEAVENADGGFSLATHAGTVTMVMGGRKFNLEGLYSPSAVHTLIPGTMFDKGDCYFKGINHCLEIWEKGKTSSLDRMLASFPRAIPTADQETFGEQFLSDLGPETNSTRVHSIYPVPDSAFTWDKPMAKSMVSTRAQSAGMAKPKTVTFGPLPEVAQTTPVTTTDMTEPAPEGMQSETRKAHDKAKSIDILAIYHQKRGHRSPEHTALMYQIESGYKLSPEAIRSQTPCSGCDAAKITTTPNQKARILPVTEVGSDVAADLIIAMPRSLSGYKHIGHIHDMGSNFGMVFNLKTKVCADLMEYWIKWLQARTGKPVLRFRIDGGEIKTAKLLAFLSQQGTEVIENLAHVHSNTSIERRHRDLIEMHNAQMITGGAPDKMWEFSIPNANWMINLCLPIKHLRKIGNLLKHAQRPLSPFELVENKGVQMPMKKLWNGMYPMFSKCTGKLEREDITNHQAPGVPGIYCGRIFSSDNVTQYGHFMLRWSDKKIVKVRTVKCQMGVYPFVQTPPKPLAAPGSSSGGESENQALELDPYSNQKLGRITPPEKFSPSTKAMTVIGPCIVMGRYDDGDYSVTFPDSPTPNEVHSIGQTQLWLEADWPDWNYNFDGKRTSNVYDMAAKARIPTLDDIENIKIPTLDDIENIKIDEIKIENNQDKANPKTERLRRRDPGSKSKANLSSAPGPSQHEVWDRGKTMTAKITLPAGTDLNPTIESIKQTEACDIERILPRHWHQTKGHPYEPYLRDAEVKELQDCINRGVFGPPQDITPDMIIIGLMWVYAVKKNDVTGLFKSFRARITLLGNQERHLVEKLMAYAPVAQALTARIMIAAHLHLSDVMFRKLDVSNAYINEYMKRMVLCKMPPGYAIVQGKTHTTFRRLNPGERQPAQCCQVVKALYGGMECGRIFWESWVDWHLKHGFQLIHEDRCYLHKRSPSGDFIKLCYHVDDNVIVARGNKFYQDYLTELATKFDYTEGELDSHLGVAYHFDRTKGEVRIEQSVQTMKFIKQFGFEDCKPASTPTMPGITPCAADCAEPCDGEWDMEAFVGHANYLHMCTRPDIGQVLKVLSRYTKSFGQRHVDYAKHLLRYLRGTVNLGLTYRTGYPLYYQIFTDASHASCVDTRRSIISIVVKLGGNTVFWKNMFTKIVSHSSTESELMALDLGATIGQSVRWLIEAVGGPTQGCIQIFVDNNGTISIASNPVQSGRNLHVHARYFYVRDLVYDEQYRIEKIPTELQVADIGCTFKGSGTFLTLRDYLMYCARVKHDTHGNPFWEPM